VIGTLYLTLSPAADKSYLRQKPSRSFKTQRSRTVKPLVMFVNKAAAKLSKVKNLRIFFVILGLDPRISFLI
jgi:hypothetical protein